MKKIQNNDIAKLFNQYADLLDIMGQNPFRIRAYRNAALSLSGMSKSVASLYQNGMDLKELPYIGKDLSQKIITIITTGEFPELKALSKKVPAFLSEIMELEGLGPKRVRILYEQLHLHTMADLQRAIDTRKLKKLKGFGDRLTSKIQKGLLYHAQYGKRFKLIDVIPVAKTLVDYLSKIPNVEHVEVAGSYRRKKETVGDLDILAIASNIVPVGKYLTQYEDVQRVLVTGKTRCSVHLTSGLQVDLRIVPSKSYGAALLYFTGSKAHNIKLRQIAHEKGLKINEYGLFKNKQRLAGKTETEVYEMLGLSYIEPELREDCGEIKAAMLHQLPHLISLQDICGDLHSHTRASDGIHTLEEMALAAQNYGYEYLAITDHSRNLAIAKGLDEKKLLKQFEEIDQLNAKLKKITLLKSAEVDILENGSLDFSNSVLQQLDITVCSVHSHFNLPLKKQTERIIRAMDNPYFNILGHPTGRLIGKREAYSIDLEKIMQAAKERGCFFELNGQPARLDLDDKACKMAKEMGVKLALSSDAHQIGQLSFIELAVCQARRGWLEKKDVLNCLKLSHLRQALKRK